ncbi:MAG: efflux RND transporter periplasmic adaptor subunit [Gemmatimonadaceae bacterium]
METQLTPRDDDRRAVMSRTFRRWTGSAALLGTVLGTGLLLAAWKQSSIKEAEAAAAMHPEPVEMVTAAVAAKREHRHTATSIGTVLALRSVELRNEVSGTVQRVALAPGRIVEAGEVLVALDVSVEEAELKALEAQAALAQTMLGRVHRLFAERAEAQTTLDRARAERDVALAQIARTKAIIARKTIRAPFRARVGISDVHAGQYLQQGTMLTTLQSVDDAVNVDFTVAQHVAATLKKGDTVAVIASGSDRSVPARIVAVDARIDPTTRNATVRARLAASAHAPAPGASVRVVVPYGQSRSAVVIPVSALRRGPTGDHVFVIEPDQKGDTRVSVRPVQSSTVLGDEVLILEGLMPGEQVASSGSFKLRQSALVAVAGDSVMSVSGAP